ncbi:hypothetical protein [Acinetobacter nosocomialis]|uniref:hypothetical protein n=1 Tax=Acinetobacter nosocomialis TaxID=106654 RepID=UPI0033B2D65E
MHNWQDELVIQSKFGNTAPAQAKEGGGERQKIQFQSRKTVSVHPKLPNCDHEIKEIGYMNFIRKLQEQQQEIVVIKADGELIRGTIKAADAETISLKCPLENGRYRTRVLFKHQISEFSPTKGIEDLVDELEASSKAKF